MPVNLHEQHQENMARLGEKGRKALAAIGLQSGAAMIDVIDLGLRLETGEEYARRLNETFTWPNSYRQGTPRYEIYEKIVASKREAAMQRSTLTSPMRHNR